MDAVRIPLHQSSRASTENTFLCLHNVSPLPERIFQAKKLINLMMMSTKSFD
jgi:hypothetical protein